MTTAEQHDEAAAEHAAADAEATDAHRIWFTGFARQDDVRGQLQRWAETPPAAQNLGPLVAGSFPEVPMLLDAWLVQGVLHWLYSEASAGKTWIALWLMLQIVRGEHDGAGNWLRPPMYVVYVDEELGEVEVAKRLKALGATPEEAARVIYFAFPGWDEASAPKLVQLLMYVRPALLVFDTATDVLAAAGHNEDSGPEVTTWVKRYVEPATQMGVTTLVLDHTGKATDGTKVTKHAVGSRAKRAKAKVQFHLGARKGYDRDTLGRLIVTRTKNTLGAPIPEERTFTVGGDGTGAFLFRPGTPTEAFADNAEEEARTTALEQRIVTYLRERPEPVYKSTAEKEITGKATDIRAALEMLAADPAQPVEAIADGKRVRYRYVTQEGAQA